MMGRPVNLERTNHDALRYVRFSLYSTSRIHRLGSASTFDTVLANLQKSRILGFSQLVGFGADRKPLVSVLPGFLRMG